MNLPLQCLACGLPLLQDSLGRLELRLQDPLVLQMALQPSGLGLTDCQLLATFAQSTGELLLREFCEGLHAQLLALQCLLCTDACCDLLLVADAASHADLELSLLGRHTLLHELVLCLQACLVAILA